MGADTEAVRLDLSDAYAHAIAAARYAYHLAAAPGLDPDDRERWTATGEQADAAARLLAAARDTVDRIPG